MLQIPKVNIVHTAAVGNNFTHVRLLVATIDRVTLNVAQLLAKCHLIDIV